jgi:diguanylate cyclase (GGDEF)-like protein/putative nucleotidyltransferase with HDIG domain
VTVVSTAALPVVAGAFALAVARPSGVRALVGVSLFLVAAVVAELNPVPLDEDGSRSVSLSFVFLLAAQICFGWQPAVIAAVASTLGLAAFQRAPVIRAVFNTAMYSLAVFASALPAYALGIDGVHLSPSNSVDLIALSFGGGAAYVVTNVVLLSGAVSMSTGTSYRVLLGEHARNSGPAFVIMAFIAGLATSLWKISPPLEILLAGPLFALALYQKNVFRTLQATHASKTDALTGLGNHRSFHTDLRDQFPDDQAVDGAFCLCVLDLDDFKAVNDRFGHPVGDDVLSHFADVLRDAVPDARAYRIGGEEFALILAHDTERSHHIVDNLHAALRARPTPHGEPITVSAGLAAHPTHAASVDELLRLADVALYSAKHQGKHHTAVYTSQMSLPQARRGAESADRAARLRAAEGLIKMVDAKDTYTGTHSQSVSHLAEGIARAFGLEEDVVAQVRLAGLLHDLGKIATPDHILQKPGSLDADETRTMQEHAELGYQLLRGIGITPIDQWIRHHHENWDGTGYPQRLAGDDIPIGSRIILVADAFDAMTTDRIYRQANTTDHALSELRRHSWSQFDARVVAALEQHLASSSDSSSSAAG